MEGQLPSNSPCQWFAAQNGWQLRRGNVMVEGNTDVRYFKLAARLYAQCTGLELLDEDLSIFSAGSGDEGGTYGILEKFPTLYTLARLDIDGNAKIKFRAIALLDDDAKGRQAIRTLCSINRTFSQHGPPHLLKRVMPRKSRDAKPLLNHTKDANAQFNGLDCVIEDLLDASLRDEYARSYPQHVTRSPQTAGGGIHTFWTQDGKFGLLRIAEQYASLAQVSQLVEVLKSLRFYLGLTTDGIARA